MVSPVVPSSSGSVSPSKVDPAKAPSSLDAQVSPLASTTLTIIQEQVMQNIVNTQKQEQDPSKASDGVPRSFSSTKSIQQVNNLL